MVDKKAVLEWITSARDYELSEIVRVTLERYRVLFPEEEVVFLSLPLDDQEERSAILRQAVEWSGRRE